MEEFHQQAVAAAADLLGASSYAASYAAGVAYVRGLLDAGAGSGALRLEIP
jgi:methylmalonyl-CoA mutase cobalamin-binding subunit